MERGAGLAFGSFDGFVNLGVRCGFLFPLYVTVLVCCFLIQGGVFRILCRVCGSGLCGFRVEIVLCDGYGLIDVQFRSRKGMFVLPIVPL